MCESARCAVVRSVVRRRSDSSEKLALFGAFSTITPVPSWVRSGSADCHFADAYQPLRFAREGYAHGRPLPTTGYALLNKTFLDTKHK